MSLSPWKLFVSSYTGNNKSLKGTHVSKEQQILTVGIKTAKIVFAFFPGRTWERASKPKMLTK